MKKTFVLFLFVSSILTFCIFTICYSGSTTAYSDIGFSSSSCYGWAATYSNPSAWNYYYISQKISSDSNSNYSSYSRSSDYLFSGISDYTSWISASCYYPAYLDSYHFARNYTTGNTWSALKSIYEYNPY